MRPVTQKPGPSRPPAPDLTPFVSHPCCWNVQATAAWWQVAGPCRPSLELNMEQGLACAAERREALPAQHFQEFRTEVFLLLFFFWRPVSY